MRLSRYFVVEFLFLLFYSVILYGGMGGSFDASIKTLNEVENSSFYLEKISYKSDVPFTEEEFTYLADLQPHLFINKLDVQRAYRNLMRKKRFSNVNVNVVDIKNGKHLIFELEGQWLLKDIKVTGFLFGKYEYGAQYLQQPGDVFDINLHEESLQGLQDFLKNQGYFDGIIEDELDYDPYDKTIISRIHFTHGKRYRIRTIDITHDSLPQHRALLDKIITETKSETPAFFASHLYTREYIKKIAQALKKRLQDKGFEQARITIKKAVNSDKKCVDVILSVDHGKRKIVNFKGNKTFSDEFIRDKFLGGDQPQWLFSAEIVREQIIHEYERHGFIDIAVNYEKNDDEYIFTIDEGKPTCLEAVEVKLVSTLEIEDSAYFWQELIDKDFFDQTLFEQKLRDFKKLYEKNGYWDFVIVDRQQRLNTLSGKMIVTIFIKKGTQRFWGGCEVKDRPDLLEHVNFKKFQLRSKRRLIPFNNSWLSEQKNMLVSALQAEGYWHADAKFDLKEVAFDDGDFAIENNKVVKLFVTWTVSPGPQLTFDKVLVCGNTKLPFNRIKNEIKFKEGEVWDKEKINLTRKKLKRLDIFKRVQVQPHQGGSSSKKPVILTVSDDDPFEVRMRAGVYVPSSSTLFKEEVTAKIGASAVAKNPTNRADKITLAADVSKFDRKVNLEYQQPSLFNFPLLGKVKLYANEFIHPLHIASSHSAYQADQIGGLVALSEEFRDHYFWGISAGNEWLKTSKVSGNIRFDPFLLNSYKRYVFVEPSLIVDYLDDKINTTRGTFSFASCKLMLPTQIADYSVRMTVEQSVFYPIYDDVIVASRLRLGHVFRKRFETIMPIERFFLGGPNSVRGYEKDAVPPIGTSKKNVIINSQSVVINEYTIQGGSSMLNANVEVRFPIMRQRIQGVIFQDLGALSQEGFFKLGDFWYPATGFGLRFKTPLGPLRFDFGWKWKKRFVNDSNYAWYLTLGEAF